MRTTIHFACVFGIVFAMHTNANCAEVQTYPGVAISPEWAFPANGSDAFFLDFRNPEMHTSPNGAIVASNYLYRAEMLAYAIPSESYAVGANLLPFLVEHNLNHNMADFTDGQDDLPENGQEMQDKHRNWQHSTFVQRSYKRTHQLFEQIINFIKEDSHE